MAAASVSKLTAAIRTMSVSANGCTELPAAAPAAGSGTEATTSVAAQVHAVRKVLDTATFVMYQLPPGKPDPKALCTPKTLQADDRPRVLSPAQKANGTCSYYAMNFLRRRIGKNHSPELAEERAREKLCSSRRKAMTAYAEGLKTLPVMFRDYMNPIATYSLKTFTKKSVPNLIANWGEGPPHEKQEVAEGLPATLPFLKQYMNPGNKFTDCFEWAKSLVYTKRTQINKTFLTLALTKLKLTPEQFFKDYGFSSSKTIDEAIASLEPSLIDSAAIFASAKLYGLAEAPWNQTHEGLLQTLHKYGPLMFSGQFAPQGYSKAPFRLADQVGGYDVYGWKPNTRLEHIKLGHAVVVVGAETTEAQKSYVYYVDPDETRDPVSKAAPKVYKISFERFVTSVQVMKKGVYAFAAKQIVATPADAKTKG